MLPYVRHQQKEGSGYIGTTNSATDRVPCALALACPLLQRDLVDDLPRLDYDVLCLHFVTEAIF